MMKVHDFICILIPISTKNIPKPQTCSLNSDSLTELIRLINIDMIWKDLGFTSLANTPTIAGMSGKKMQEEGCRTAGRQPSGQLRKRQEIENKRQSLCLMRGWSAAPSAATKGLTQLFFP